MSKPASKTMIGGFVVLAFALAIASVLAFGTGKLFEKTYKFVLFFDRSVKGLDPGASVIFRGVKVGSVESVVLRADPKTLSAKIPVIINIDPSSVEFASSEFTQDPYKDFPLMIEKGLRAQLTIQSLVTGQLLIELDFHPDEPIKLAGKDEKYPEIPTIPTPLDKLAGTLKELDLKALYQKLLSLVDGIDEVVHDPDVKESIHSLRLALDDARKLLQGTDVQVQAVGTSAESTLKDYGKLARNIDTEIKPVASNVNKALKEYDKLARDVDAQVEPLASSIDKTLVDARAALKQGEKTLATAEYDLSEDSTTMYELNNTLREFSAMARSIRQLADYLKQHPEALLTGKKPSGGE
jgi:paraquat-inducible protein B